MVSTIAVRPWKMIVWSFVVAVVAAFVLSSRSYGSSESVPSTIPRSARPDVAVLHKCPA